MHFVLIEVLKFKKKAWNFNVVLSGSIMVRLSMNNSQPPTKKTPIVSWQQPPNRETPIVSWQQPPTKETPIVSWQQPPTKETPIVSWQSI